MWAEQGPGTSPKERYKQVLSGRNDINRRKLNKEIKLFKKQLKTLKNKAEKIVRELAAKKWWKKLWFTWSFDTGFPKTLKKVTDSKWQINYRPSPSTVTMLGRLNIFTALLFMDGKGSQRNAMILKKNRISATLNEINSAFSPGWIMFSMSRPTIAPGNLSQNKKNQLIILSRKINQLFTYSQDNYISINEWDLYNWLNSIKQYIHLIDSYNCIDIKPITWITNSHDEEYSRRFNPQWVNNLDDFVKKLKKKTRK